MYDLKEIQTRAMELYRQGVFPPDNLKQAMKAAGVPEEAMWDIRQDLRKLESPAPPLEPRKKSKKVAPSLQNGPPETIWQGNLNLRGHVVNLAELNKRDRKLAAAHDDKD